MKIRTKIEQIALVVALLLPINHLFAQKQSSTTKATPQKVLMLSDGSQLTPTILELTQSGDFRYSETASADSPRLTVRKNKVKWAWVSKPDEITVADNTFNRKEYQNALTKFEECQKAWGALGWEPYCKLKIAQCMKELKREADAQQLLETLVNYPAESPYNQDALCLAYEELSKYYSAKKEYDKSLDMLKKMLYGSENSAVTALIARGDLLLAKGNETGSVNDKRDAFNSFAQACLIYPNSSRAAEAAFRAYQALNALNDARSKVFADLLKKKYPKSNYTKQLN